MFKIIKKSMDDSFKTIFVDQFVLVNGCSNYNVIVIL